MRNKVIIITGASSGIGLACAREFAQRGAKLVLAARSAEKLAEIQDELKAAGSEVISVKTDVSVKQIVLNWLMKPLMNSDKLMFW